MGVVTGASWHVGHTNGGGPPPGRRDACRSTTGQAYARDRRDRPVDVRAVAPELLAGLRERHVDVLVERDDGALPCLVASAMGVAAAEELARDAQLGPICREEVDRLEVVGAEPLRHAEVAGKRAIAANRREEILITGRQLLGPRIGFAELDSRVV